MRGTNPWWLLCGLSLVGCGGAPIVGDWEAEEPDNDLDSFSDKLSIEDEETGTRTARAENDGVAIKVVWNITYKEGSGEREFDIELECDSASLSGGGVEELDGCDEVFPGGGDQEAECKVNDDETEMECELEGGTEITYVKKE